MNAKTPPREEHQSGALARTCGVARARCKRSARFAGARGGFTLLEIAFSILILVIGVLGFSQALVRSGRSQQKTREADQATQAARKVLESIQAEAFVQAFRRYNADPTDDPGGANTAPGANFAVEGLSALPSDADGRPGEVIFPTPAGLPGQLREDVTNALLGMPRDLNGDGVIDAVNHSTSYKLLPVQVRVRWRSPSGPGVVELHTLLANY